MLKAQEKSLDNLVTGIKLLLSENRCSFSDEEKVLLINCIASLEEFKKVTTANGPANFNTLVKVFEVLSRILLASDNLKDLL
ncbi:MAG TPA: hypothetical protein VK476_00530 [Flavobacterium sp.]|nr:hypothetical protein [Flavobacterium sp.]